MCGSDQAKTHGVSLISLVLHLIPSNIDCYMDSREGAGFSHIEMLWTVSPHRACLTKVSVLSQICPSNLSRRIIFFKPASTSAKFVQLDSFQHLGEFRARGWYSL